MFDRSVLGSDDAQAVRAALEALLTDCHGNVTLASRRAGIERQSMHRLLKRHGLSAADFRPRGGGSIIARAALKNLGAQLSTPAAPATRTLGRDFTRSAVREVVAKVPVRDLAARARDVVYTEPADHVESADAAVIERRAVPHHRPYQTDLGRAALHALVRAKLAG